VNQIEALRRLKTLGTPGFETRDAAVLLGVTPSNANMILRRLARSGLLTHLSRGRWLADPDVNRFALPELICAPYPAYVSLQSALFHHGVIEQVLAVIYAVTLARPRRVRTPLGVVSFHRMPPELFTGFEVEDANGAKIATGEKALFDLLYLAPGRSRLFATLPELEIPRRFHWSELQKYIGLVRSPSRRTFVAEGVKRLKENAGVSRH
jgi:predicted transcriptional regulator of viral defense system